MNPVPKFMGKTVNSELRFLMLWKIHVYVGSWRETSCVAEFELPCEREIPIAFWSVRDEREPLLTTVCNLLTTRGDLWCVPLA